MKSKTLTLINYHTRLLKEQPEEQPDPNAQQSPQDVQQVTEPAPQPQETEPLTSEGENEYITNLIDAALFKPSAEEAKTLMNLQNVMQLKHYENAREEVLPFVLAIIHSENSAKDLKQNLSSLD